MEKTVSSIEGYREPAELIEHASDLVLKNFEDELHLVGCRIYRREGDHFELRSTLGKVKRVEPGFSIPADYPPVEQALEAGIVLLDRSSPGVDPAIEDHLQALQARMHQP